MLTLVKIELKQDASMLTSSPNLRGLTQNGDFLLVQISKVKEQY
jgi:hypothetical protein